ncbi:hypothetical protein GCM10009745_19650 [Kribbella yunnanensis]|uniref:CU044_5270 family protein n=1 Tax=Kribbella yunnanensis TaxID=190194 RepID=A0ABN2GTB6_9ACTN
MNELDLLKQVRNDVPAPDPLALARARQRLLTPPPVRRRTHARVLVAAGVAVVLTGGFLAADVIDHDNTPLPGAVADAGTFLAEAAAQTASQPDVRIPSGQFLQVTTLRTYLVGFGPQKKYQATTMMVEDKWITADPFQQYPGRLQELAKVTFTTREAQLAARTQAPWLFKKPKSRMDRVTCRGLIVQPNLDPKILQKPCTADWFTPTTDFLARQPRDPDALLAVLRQPAPAQESRRVPLPADEVAFFRINAALNSGIVPSDLRAALYQAARKIPGIKLLNDVTTVDGRHGRAVGYTTQQRQRWDIIISPSDGQSIGSRLVQPNGDIYTATSVTSRLTTTRPALR